MSFFADVKESPPDPLLSISQRVKADSRSPKYDLGVGVLRRTDNTSHEFATVIKAAKDVPPSCYYPHPGGDDDLVRLSAELIFGSLPPRVAGVQTVGGSGALRVCAEMLVHQGMTSMLLPDPSWANHKPLLGGGGLQLSEYRYFDQGVHGVDFEGMVADIKACPPRSSVMLQVAAHNPTGADLTDAQWDQLLELFAARTDILPVFDSAYQGLARGLEEDVRVVRKFLERGLEFMLCNSFSKNFGLYGERAGTFFVACQSPQIATCVTSLMKLKIRTNYSVPPLHGARIVKAILSDPALRAAWEAELSAAREAVNTAHKEFAGALRDGGLERFAKPRFGLFAQLFLSAEQVSALASDHAVYCAPLGRINVSSLDAANAKAVANAVVAVCK